MAHPGAYHDLGLGPVESRRPEKRPSVSLETLYSRGCELCPLDKLESFLCHPKMEATGAGHPLIYMLGEAAGEKEDKQGEQFVGPSGELIRDLIPSEFEDEIRWNNTIRCFLSPKVVVYTHKGYRMIKDVHVGDLVLTHKGRFRRVLSRTQDLPLEDRRYTGDRIQVDVVRSSYGHGKPVNIKQVVTPDHQFLLPTGKWIAAEDLRDGDEVMVLAEECIVCGKLFYGGYHASVDWKSYCSIQCHNEEVVGRPESRKKLSKYMLNQYASGQRGPEMYAAAIAKSRELSALGLSCVWFTEEDRWKQRMAMSRCRGYKVRGENEEVFEQALISNGYNVVVNHHITVRKDRTVCVYDLCLKEHKILIEVDGKSHNNRKVWARDQYKDEVAVRFGYQLIRVHYQENPEELLRQVKRLIRNHSGDYKFISAKVLVKRLPPSAGPSCLYCLEVEGDASFVSKGVVSHNCRPPKNRTPAWIEIECCRSFIVEDIKKSQPKAIFGIGGVPLTWATGDDGIYKWRGRYLPVKIGSHTCWFFPMLHPAGLLRQRRKSRSGKLGKSEAEYTFERDLARAFELVVKLPPAEVVDPYRRPTLPKPSYRRPTGLHGAPRGHLQGNGHLSGNGDPEFVGIEYVAGIELGDLDRVLKWLDACSKQSVLALDLETGSAERIRDRQTRPYGAESRILSIALAYEGKSLAFALRHKQAGWTDRQLKKIEQVFVNLLKTYKGTIVAHNLRFELEWLIYFYGKDLAYSVKWADSMGQAYVLDERRGMLSLDSLILQHFGFNLKSLMKLNTSSLDNERIEDVLTYNALDALYEHKLYMRQRELLRAEKLEWVYENHIPPILATTLTQHFGNRIDFGLVEVLGEKYTKDIERLAALIAGSEEVTRFEKANSRHKFNPSSARDVIVLFKEILQRSEGVVEGEDGKAAKYSVDDNVLKAIGTPFAVHLQEYRAALGHRSKYIEPLGVDGECVFPDGRVHPNIHVFFTKTGRTSSSWPNEQFWPRDDPYRELRGEFVPEDDCWLVAIDQGQIEARVIGMASKDRKYGKYLWDRHDVHMDWTVRLAHAYPERIGGKKFLKDKDVLKRFRTDVKNQFTFPLFFGASANSVAKYLSIPVEAVEEVVEEFWSEFSGVKKWQKNLENFYRKNGFVQCLTGRRRRAPISHNELINAPIQGSASDITISAMTRLSRLASDLDLWQYQPRMEVHDELVFHLPKKTFDKDLEVIVDYMLECKHFPWITVPLAVEVKKGPDWYHLQEIGTFFSDDLNKLDRAECGF